MIFLTCLIFLTCFYLMNISLCVTAHYVTCVVVVVVVCNVWHTEDYIWQTMQTYLSIFRLKWMYVCWWFKINARCLSVSSYFIIVIIYKSVVSNNFLVPTALPLLITLQTKILWGTCYARVQSNHAGDEFSIHKLCLGHCSDPLLRRAPWRRRNWLFSWE